MTWQVLFTDASELDGDHGHHKVAGVVDATGRLLASRDVGYMPINLAEMEGVLLAIDHMQSDCGVVLTDSLDAVKWLGGNSRKSPYGRHMDDLLRMRVRLREAWPKAGWVIAWIPELQNIAHKPVVAKARELMRGAA